MIIKIGNSIPLLKLCTYLKILDLQKRVNTKIAKSFDYQECYNIYYTTIRHLYNFKFYINIQLITDKKVTWNFLI